MKFSNADQSGRYLIQTTMCIAPVILLTMYTLESPEKGISIAEYLDQIDPSIIVLFIVALGATESYITSGSVIVGF